jgi:hypothetical protein
MRLLSKERDGLFTARMGRINMVAHVTVTDGVCNLWCSNHQARVVASKTFVAVTSYYSSTSQII